MRAFWWMAPVLVGCPKGEGGKDGGALDATGHWTGACEQIGGVELDLTDADGVVTGSLAESTGTSDAMVVDGTRTDDALVLEVTYAGSQDLLGTFELTLDGDSLDGVYLYPGDDSGYTCSFDR